MIMHKNVKLISPGQSLDLKLKSGLRLN